MKLNKFIIPFIIIIIIIVGYYNTLHAPFVSDDLPSIKDNESIRDIRNISNLINTSKYSGDTIQGRPILNISYAVNYVFSKNDPIGYHLTNIVIHIINSLLVYYIILLYIESKNLYKNNSKYFSLTVTLLFALHPIQTESVTYLSQRAESLMALFLLFSIYCLILIRYKKSNYTSALGCISCILCALTKEISIILPFVLIIVHQIFSDKLVGKFKLKYIYIYTSSIVSSCIVLYLIFYTSFRGNTIGSGSGISMLEYTLCQSYANIYYIELFLLPKNLIFDYGNNYLNILQALPYLILLILILLLIIKSYFCNSLIGKLGLLYFIILAPSSSILGGKRQMISEHRMYLPIIILCILSTLLIYKLKSVSKYYISLIIITILLASTITRNATYNNAIALYRDVINKRPQNQYAHYNLGCLYEGSGDFTNAIREYKHALDIDPFYTNAYNNIANIYIEHYNMYSEGITNYINAIKYNFKNPTYHYNYALSLSKISNQYNEEVVKQYSECLQLDDHYISAYNNLAMYYYKYTKLNHAKLIISKAILINSNDSQLHCNYAIILLAGKEENAAIKELMLSIKLDRDNYKAIYNLANIYYKSMKNKNIDKAIFYYSRSLEIKKDFTESLNNLANIYYDLGEYSKSIYYYKSAIHYNPSDYVFHYNLALSFEHDDKKNQALSELEIALRINPNIPGSKSFLERLK